MNIRIDEGLRAYIDPLTDDEREALERSPVSYTHLTLPTSDLV